MSLDLRDCDFTGPAMPEPFVRFRLEDLLARKKLLTHHQAPEAKKFKERWEVYRRKLRGLGDHGGEVRVQRHVLEPLLEFLGWSAIEPAGPVVTREGEEDGGLLLRNEDGAHLRAWVVAAGTDLDAPNRRGRAYRFSPGLVAQRVLLTHGERIGLVTDGLELRILLSDPSGRDSHIAIRLDRTNGWRSFRDPPDSLRLLIALCQPKGLAVIAELLDEARLSQTTVTKKLREQARRAIENFLQGILEDPSNTHWRRQEALAEATPLILWREGLVLVYRLLFVLKLENAPDPARCFSFASATMWRRSFSPTVALSPFVEKILNGTDTGNFLASSLRALFKMFAVGLEAGEMVVTPLDGLLFGPAGTPTLDSLHWSERAVAELLDALLSTPAESKGSRERIHYGSLDVEDLGRVYEALLELDPGISTEPMCRLRRAKLEVVVPRAQGEPYRKAAASVTEDDEEELGDDEGEGKGKGKTKVVFIEDIPADRFFLRVGLGRKSSGSYYTPHAFVRFLVEETLGPQVCERSPKNDPQPLAILGVKVLDPAMGSGHFLVEACRYLGDALYEACRLCDERAKALLDKAGTAKNEAERARLNAEAQSWWAHVEALPDPSDEIMAYLPSRIVDAYVSGVSQRKALSICRRLVAVHCLYGVDKNPLAVELARVSLWLESYAEGWPLTFLDHRLIAGDSLTGPFFAHLLTYPVSGEPIDDLFSQRISDALTDSLAEALVHVSDLEASIGRDLADIEHKRELKRHLDDTLAPFRRLAQVWAGGVGLADNARADSAYRELLFVVANKRPVESVLATNETLQAMVDLGSEGVAYDLCFPEVFFPDGKPAHRAGFDAVLGNPPWNKIRFEMRELAQLLNPSLLLGKETGFVDKGARKKLLASVPLLQAFESAAARERQMFLRLSEWRAQYRGTTGGDPDLYQAFVEHSAGMVRPRGGALGMLMPGGLVKNPADSFVRLGLANDEFGLQWLVHFVNMRSIFEDLPPVLEFAAIVLRRQSPGLQTRVSWNHVDIEFLAEKVFWCDSQDAEEHRQRVADTGQFLASQDATRTNTTLLRLLGELHVTLQNDLHRTSAEDTMKPVGDVLPGVADARDAIPALVDAGWAACYTGRSIAQFQAFTRKRSGKWSPEVDLVARLSHPKVERIARRLSHYRLSIRSTCGSPHTNQRSVVACILPPLVLSSNSLWAESEPALRPNSHALAMSALLNAFCVDHLARPHIVSNFNKEHMARVPAPALSTWQEGGRLVFLAHAALRLEANGDHYGSLWHEQLGLSPPSRWPVLADEDARWAVRAAIDVIVADAYGLTREGFADVLASFNHRAYPNASQICLGAYDELRSAGLVDFLKRHDPHHDIPLVTTLPTPVFTALASAANKSFSLERPEPKPTRTGVKKGRRP